jgi:hypothetical protein
MLKRILIGASLAALTYGSLQLAVPKTVQAYGCCNFQNNCASGEFCDPDFRYPACAGFRGMCQPL